MRQRDEFCGSTIWWYQQQPANAATWRIVVGCEDSDPQEDVGLRWPVDESNPVLAAVIAGEAPEIFCDRLICPHQIRTEAR